MIKCQDWRDAPADVVNRLYDAECVRWRHSLCWDYSCTSRLVEAARLRRSLPGLLARDDAGEVVGWTYFLLHDDTLHIGNLVALGRRVVRALVGAVARSPEAQHATSMACFLYPTCAGLEEELGRSHFAIERHAYLRVGLADCGLTAPPLGDGYAMRPASPAVPEMARLLSQAYEGAPCRRCFARDGRPEQWVTYVAQLTQTLGCGRFEPALSVSIETDAGELVGIALVTSVAEGTAHVAQMAVAAAHRRRGLGEQLVKTACQRAAAAGYDLMTLVVAESNQPARRLYDRVGFEPGAGFVFADREM